MDFLNKLSNMASETYKKTSKKTGELAQEAKIRMKMNEDKGKIKDLYEEIGKIVYQKHKDGADPTETMMMAMYMLAAMEFFDNYTLDDVHRIAIEIAMEGVKGIEPKKY